MAIDFQVVFPQEAIRLNSVRLSPPGGPLPRSLTIRGEDFRSVDEVLINDIESPDVVIISKNLLIAQLPDVFQKVANVNTVSVLSRNLTITPRSFIRFRIPDQPGRVRGILRLIQLYLKLLFTTPGTDIFSPRSGGGALRNVGETFGADEGGDIISDFVIAVDQTSRQVVSQQSREPRLPLDERLLSAKVTNAGFNRELGALLVTIELVSQAGRAALANLEL